MEIQRTRLLGTRPVSGISKPPHRGPPSHVLTTIQHALGPEPCMRQDQSVIHSVAAVATISQMKSSSSLKDVTVSAQSLVTLDVM